jgi:hypothetical protein
VGASFACLALNAVPGGHPPNRSEADVGGRQDRQPGGAQLGHGCVEVIPGIELPGVVAQPAENTANAAANTATTVLTARIFLLVFLAPIDRAFRLLDHTRNRRFPPPPDAIAVPRYGVPFSTLG